MRQNRGVPGRRLILILVLLLVSLSVLSASRDISRRGPAGQSPGTTQQPADNAGEPARDRPAGGQRAEVPVRPATRPVARRLPSERPVRARLGDRVVLSIRTGSPDILAVDALGIRAPTGPGTAGTLDFVAGSAGTYPVKLAIGERRVGRLAISR